MTYLAEELELDNFAGLCRDAIRREGKCVVHSDGNDVYCDVVRGRCHGCCIEHKDREKSAEKLHFERLLCICWNLAELF